MLLRIYQYVLLYEQHLRTYDDAKSCDLDMFRKYFLHMMKNGFNIPQSQFESMFLSAVHTEEHIDKFLEAFKKL